MGKKIEKYVLNELKETKAKLHDRELMLLAEKHTRQVYECRLDKIRTMVMDIMDRAPLDEHEALEYEDNYMYSFRLYSTITSEDFKQFCELLDLEPKDCFND